jgi:hypothetical protein
MSTENVMGDYFWSFKISLKTAKKVVFFSSPSHEIKLVSHNHNAT